MKTKSKRTNNLTEIMKKINAKKMEGSNTINRDSEKKALYAEVEKGPLFIIPTTKQPKTFSRENATKISNDIKLNITQIIATTLHIKNADVSYSTEDHPEEKGYTRLVITITDDTNSMFIYKGPYGLFEYEAVVKAGKNILHID